MSNPKVSIAMATYNGSPYIREQLESLAGQTLLPSELIVSDDCSTDNTLDIISEFRSSAPFAIAIHQNAERIGVQQNFANAISLCKGDIIFICDQDDFWLPTKLQVVLSQFAQAPYVFVVINDQVIANSRLQTSGYTTLGNIKAVGLSDAAFIAGCCTAFRSELRSVLLPIPDQEAYDGWIHRLADYLGVRMVLRIPLQFYRRHDRNVSKWLADEMRPLSEWDLMQQYRLKSAADGWDRQIVNIERWGQRINEAAEHLQQMGLGDAVETAIASMDADVRALRRRTHIVSVPRAKRLRCIISFWLSGGYGHFSGWRSAIKDSIRAN